MKKIGIVRFLGTNCDRDIWQAVEEAQLKPSWLWHEDHFNPSEINGIIIPGGFSYGDYLRCGALAARAAVMDSVRESARLGIPILGICNGFQILCEAGLLPGALVQNKNLHFIDQWNEIELVSCNSHWGRNFSSGQKVSLPIAHGEGRYYAEEETLKEIEDHGQVWWRYHLNPNGSLNDIAGITNRMGNVAALMPHPERAIFDWMGSAEGLKFFVD